MCQIIHVDSALQVDNSREISEFDEEAQAAIQRASYDHRMKMQGLPTSSDKVRPLSLSRLTTHSHTLTHTHSLTESTRHVEESVECRRFTVQGNTIRPISSSDIRKLELGLVFFPCQNFRYSIFVMRMRV